MPLIRLTLEYEGTAYAGWQLQPNGLSVQEVVESALAQVVGEKVRLISSGRTDAGVHARGMVAHFEVGRDLPMSAYREGVNRFLPPDIAVKDAQEAPPGFHARFSARGKWYRYLISTSPVRSPLVARYSWHVRGSLDLSAMQGAAAHFRGLHDFAAFRGAGCEARTTVREIFSVDVAREEELLAIDVRGGGFLRNMVRVMVGTLVEIGLGRRPPADVPLLLQEGSRPLAGRTAPPQGLCLMEVWYGGEVSAHALKSSVAPI
jgi:tRNA pseudouridine38-40 synthase